ncbi:phospholipid-binding lipoprotein MlaA [Azospirillum fermentarium]|uniref:MlaA family lipoprotein n=1 Tax=Azospirillum fermentarium TaxID=1233114 RepID=UPI002226ABB3|nr:MlaA family lipoprotein [Azospirillum fermentarium]MCW2249379.1 phospholipid-binding lipoprotein MlaA [Azospirillum fermentarium]
MTRFRRAFAAAALCAATASGAAAATATGYPPEQIKTGLPRAALKTAQAPKAETPAAEGQGGFMDGYSRFMFGFNQRLYDNLDAAGGWFGGGPAAAPPDPAAGSVQNMVANLVNEPLTAVSSTLIGEFGNAWRSVERFGINSTAGVLGYYDTASQWGYPPTHTDVGLSLCRSGVGEMGYVVLPFVGPRTGRDAIADIVLMNAMLWTFAGVAAGTGASFQTIVIAESVEVAADITATRQFDIEAKKIRLRDYDETRAAYLKQRRARCAQAMSAAR